MLFEFPSGMKRFGSRYHCFVFVGKSKGREHHRDFSRDTVMLLPYNLIAFSYCGMELYI